MQKCEFRDGDEVSRSSFIFDGKLLNFISNAGDLVGIYPTAKINDDGTTSKTGDETQQSPFVLQETGTGFIHIDPAANADNFTWANGFDRTSYFPYNSSFDPGNDIKYTALPFSFKDQVQQGYVNLTAYYNGDASGNKGNNSQVYIESETKACEHLNKCNFLISPESKYANGHIRFSAHPVGAVARFYLLAPKETLKLKSLRLVASEPVFYEEGTVDLSSQPYNSGATDKNEGLKLVSASYTEDSQRQMHPKGEPSASVELKFAEGVSTTYNATTSPYGHYMIAYLMMYPVDLTKVSELYVYLEAEDAAGNKKNFRTSNLEKKNMYSGNYYQWMYKALDDEHPIELTATVIPWQDIAGGNINLGDDDE